MFCPKCGHQQVSDDIRFCARCGLSLGIVTDMVVNTGNQLQREKRELTGIALMMAAILMLLNFIIVFGTVTLPHLANPVSFWIWLSFVLSSLLVSGFGLANLIRSGFFKRLKERQARMMMSPERVDQVSQAEAIPRLVEPASVTEMTTRELQRKPKD